jgi:predicted nucleic acid-binding protein
MITQTDAFVVVLDTCVLAPMPLCDTLLRLAEDPAFYMPRWSAGILEELRRVLLRMQYSGAQAERRITAMQTAFEDACVTGYAELVPSMTNDEKDRHVLASAVRAGAHAILTENVKHFPAESVEPYNIDVLTPDQFLAHQFHLNRDLLEEKLRGQARLAGFRTTLSFADWRSGRRRCPSCSWNLRSYVRYSAFRFCSTSLMKLRLILYFARSASIWRTNSAPRSRRFITDAAFASRLTGSS